ncbi:diacylglycerol kinase family protein [Desulforhabdus sp. TSK]|uniref:diacylglycerol/lipid kinase family protein n=1 Tax=Desulforhabdus sp. TSK TaxID=2925014 RepID=UPI001FC87E37|nr:acylglycerol kinase family protein [Desulforhabdus sp. TSK]GKT09078.1 diacylglycerol kinase [Desulforhabdus sp. TSK]
MPIREDILRPARGNHAPRRPMTLGMITNPLSGGNKKGIQGVRAFLAQNPGMHHGMAVTPADVSGLLADFSERGVELLVVNGGDGTVQAVLTALFGRSLFPIPPVLALLRAGTTSMLARDVGVRGKPPDALAKIHAWNMDAGRSNRAILERPIMRVSQEGRSKPVCGMFFGSGAILQGIDLCHGSMNPRGIRGELMPGLVMARLVSAFLAGNEKLLPPTEMLIGLEGRQASRQRYLFALVTTLERLFLGLRPFWGNEHAPLHFTAVKSKSAHLLRNLPFLLRGRHTATASPENGFFSHNVQRVRLDFRGRFTLDGEIFEAGAPLTVESAGPARFLHI